MLDAAIEELLGELGKLAPCGYHVGLHIRFVAPLMSYNTYDKAWIDHYTRRGFALSDPTVAWGLTRSGAVRWRDITLPDPRNVLATARRFGLNFGVSVAIGPASSRTIAGVARSDREFLDSEIEAIEETVWKLHRATKPPTNLTQAELEALRHVATGRRHAEGAAALNISESAFKARLTAARRKLKARTTTQAVRRARDFRLL